MAFLWKYWSHCHSYVTCILLMPFACSRTTFVCYLHVIHMSFECTRKSFVCLSYLLFCHSYATCMYYDYIWVHRMLFVCTHKSFVCHSYVLVHQSYTIRIYSMSSIFPLVCFRLSFVCQSYVLVCRTYVFLPATLTRYLFSKIIECSEKSNTRMNAKEFENKSITNNHRIQNKWKDYKIFKYSDEYKTSQKQINCKKPSNTKKINNV